MAQTTSREEALSRAREELAEEHRQLRFLITRLREAREVPGLLQALAELQSRLREHFAHEEFPNGLYETMGALAREHAAEVRELVDEHFLLLATLRGLADQARRHRDGPPDTLMREAAALAERLRSHEEKELELVERLETPAR